MKLTANVASVLSILGLSLALSSTAGASTAHDKIVERIKASGNICVEGDESCGGAVALAATASSGERSGEEVYNTACTACHAVGVAGAPKFGSSEWATRAEKGMDALLQTAISGINAMPPKGTCNDCSNDELSAAIQYMIDSAK